MASTTGKKFEALIKDSCTYASIDYTRFRDAGFTGVQTEGKRFTIKNICDCFIFKNGNLVYIEAKSRGQSLTFKDITQEAALVKKQGELRDKGLTPLAKTGILVEFQKTSKYYFIHTAAIDLLKQLTSKKSFNTKDCETLLLQYPQFCTELSPFVPKGNRKALLNIEELVSLPF